MHVARELERFLRSHGAKVLNSFDRTLSREPLLRKLSELGVNGFRVHRIPDMQCARFPVFLRSRTHHHGSFSSLLENQKELERAIVASVLGGKDARDLLVVEFVDTADETGMYRKFGAFVVDGRIIPTHLFFARTWMVKQARVQDEGLLEEESVYVRSNPHERELLEVAQIAGIDYGRIDYALSDGRIQVWEINTNPNIGGSRSRPSAADRRADVRALFLRRFAGWLAEVDEDVGPGRDSDPLGVCTGRSGPSGGRGSHRAPRLHSRLAASRTFLLDMLAIVLRPILLPLILRSLAR